MKEDLQRLMEERNVDAVVGVAGHGSTALIKYLTNGSYISNGYMIYPRGTDPVLIVSGIEVGPARESGLEVHHFGEFDYMEISKQYADEPHKFRVELFRRILDRFGIKGNLLFYGNTDISGAYFFLNELAQSVPEIAIVNEGRDRLLYAATRTKSADEIEQMKLAARYTCEVMQEALDFIVECRTKDGVIYRGEKPLLIGDVKRHVRSELMKRGMEDSEDMIFAQGDDGGYPHMNGDDAEPLRLGAPIVFDLYPQQKGGGYFHDMTRTWCFGHAPDEVLEAYEQVLEIQERMNAAFTAGEKCSKYQEMVCDYFEERGHKTHRTDPESLEGYIHSLGHGVGLNIHESPMFGQHSQDVIEIGNVFTNEPGLYYPERGFGIRIEDTVYVKEDGTIERLTDFPKDLVYKVGP